ncbi:MAG: hypothetical protein ACFCU7_13670 [Pleurocapsa sp.]
MRLFKSFSSNQNKTASESFNPQTAAILISYGLSGKKNRSRPTRINQPSTK